MAMENNAMPYEFGNIGSQLQAATSSITNTGHMGDLVYYELLHWGALPSSSSLTNTIVSALSSYGLAYLAEYAGMFATYILAALLSGGALTTGTILDALTSALGVIGIGLGTGGAVLVTVAAVIVGA